MMKCDERNLDEAKRLDKEDLSIELKYDGSRQFWLMDKLVSDRGCNNTEKFEHISKFLKGINAILDGEIYVPYKTVLDLNRKENWPKSKFAVFDILELNGVDLRSKSLEERQKVLLSLLNKLNASNLIHFPMKFTSVDEGWNFILDNDLEGLVLKDKKSSYSLKDILTGDRRNCWIKVKNHKEGKEKIVGYEAGSYKGAFLLENGSKVSALKPEIADIWLKNKNKEIFVEFMYLNRTKDGKYFQPVLKRLVTKKGEVLYE